jgi:hypothetical protein
VREAAHAVGRVAELALAEAHRADVQRGHPGPRLDELLARLVGHVEADAGGELDQRRAALLDQPDHAPGDVEVGGRPAVGVAQVDVDDRRARLVGLERGGGDLLGGGGQRRVVGLGGDRPGQRRGEHGLAHAATPLASPT